MLASNTDELTVFSSNKDEDEMAGMMTLTKEEVGWTHAVKAAALEDESLKKLSDYEYAQHAMFTNGDVEKSLFQIEGMQHFKEEYNITDTVEEGVALFRQYREQQPWFLLDIGYEDDSFVLVYDYAQFIPSKIKLPEDWRSFLGGFYYLCQMVTSNLLSIREGVVLVGDVEGMGWKNVSIEFTNVFWEHLFRFYPLHLQEVSWVHNSVMGNIFESLHRSIMKERSWNIQIGVQSEVYDGGLDALFKTPTPEIAFDRVMDKSQTLLTKRFQRYKSYRLPPIAPALTEEEILFQEAMEAIHAGNNQDSEEDSDGDEEGSHDEASVDG